MTKRAHYGLKLTLGCVFSAIASGATTFGVVSKWVYTREEGKTLETRVDKVEEHYRQDIREVRDALTAIRDALPRAKR